MLSRIADSLYWLDRYMARTDGVLRNLRTEFVLSLDMERETPATWRPVLQLFTQAEAAELDVLEQDTSRALRYIVTEHRNNNSLRALLSRARENARGAQDHITKEVWEQVNLIYHEAISPAIDTRLDGQEALPVLDRLTEMVTLYEGVTSSTMPRSLGWSFMNLGKYVERCIITIEMMERYMREIQYDLDDNRDILFWRHLLLSLSGYELHLKIYRNNQHTLNVTDQIFFNRQFTRSIRYALDKMEHYLDKVTDLNHPDDRNQLTREFGRLHSLVRYGDLHLIKQVGPKQFLSDIRMQLFHFNRLLTQIFFSYT